MSPENQPPSSMFRRMATVAALSWSAGPWLSSMLLAGAAISGMLPAAATWLTKLVIDDLAAGRGRAAVGTLGVGLAVLGVVTAVLPHALAFLQGQLRRRLDRSIQDRLYTAVNSQPGLANFENPRYLDKLRLATQVTGGALAPATTGLFGGVRTAITLASLLATLYLLSPVMAAIVVAAGIPALAAQIWLSRSRMSTLARATPATRRQFFYTSLITDVQAAKEVRLLGLGTFLKQRLLGELDTVHEGERRLDRQVLRGQTMLALLGSAVAGLGLLWAVGAAADGRLSLGDVSAFIAAVAGTQAAIIGMVELIASAHQALLLFGYYTEVTTATADLPAARRPAALGPLRRGIELRDVWFRYDDDHPWVLQGVNLTIAYGTALALVGLNGAGKSTVVKLLCRFYDPTRGSILWDGIDIRDVPLHELRQRTGALFQDFMSYDLTAAENIGVGDLPRLTDRDRVEAAARAAGVHDTMAGLPRGYDTMLSRVFFLNSDKDNPDSGVVLSGGQRQRIALARTLMRDGCDLLILDEPSAGLDAEAEHQVHEQLRRHRSGRTSLLISHRLGAVRDADWIAVLAEGRVIEEGRHADLLDACGVYARLFTVQSRGYQPQPAVH